MIVYLDASALVKRYVAEAGTAEVERLVAQADTVGTALISRAEVAAALAKAVRLKALDRGQGARALQQFRSHWPYLLRLQLRELTAARAEALAWDYGLRGYDAIHLAATAIWQESLGEPVTLATYARQLWEAARRVGLAVWPDGLP
jgi:predicted nucleic acid-binding protein